MIRAAWQSALLLAALAFSTGCPGRVARPEVVVYCSLDEPYARPVLAEYERSTGIRVVPLFDTEATKSVGLAQRIRAERRRPRADVFWSSEAVRLIRLKQEALLEPYASPSAFDIPERYRDPDAMWTGFAARARVIVYNTRRVRSPPQSMLELQQPRWASGLALSNPRAGSAATEAAALFARLGTDRARAFYRGLSRQGARVVDGNAMAADWTARGQVLVGLTDTDDAYLRQDQKLPLGIIFPDQQGVGTLLIPNTAGLVRGAPHADEGRRFLDYLLDVKTEIVLSRLPSRQIPLHASALTKHKGELSPAVQRLAQLKRMVVDYEVLARRMPEVDRFLRESFQP